jgi:hypothetical protein
MTAATINPASFNMPTNGFIGDPNTQFIIDAPSRTVNLTSNFLSDYQLVVGQGTFNTNNYPVKFSIVNANGASVRAINLGTSNVVITRGSGGNYAWNVQGPNITVDAINATLEFTAHLSATGAIFFAGGGFTYGKIFINTTTPAYGATYNVIFIADSDNTFNNLKFGDFYIIGGNLYGVYFFNTATVLNIVNLDLDFAPTSLYQSIFFGWNTGINSAKLNIANVTGGPVPINLINVSSDYNSPAGNQAIPLSPYFPSDLPGGNYVTKSAGATSNNLGSYNYSVGTPTSKRQKVYLITSGTSWTAPIDFNTQANNVLIIGGGGGGSGASQTPAGNSVAGCGGGGGGATKIVNANILAGVTYTVAIGAGGTSGAGNNTSSLSQGGNGGTTSMTIGGTTYSANGGTGGQSNVTGSVRIAGTGGTGTTNNGGNGAIGGIGTTPYSNAGGGGGGSGGNQGNGANGGSCTLASGSSGSGGGGGGSSGGTAGANASLGTTAPGGQNYEGVGGGTTTVAYNGGGGASLTYPAYDDWVKNGSPSTDFFGFGGSGGGGGGTAGGDAFYAQNGGSASFGGGGGGAGSTRVAYYMQSNGGAGGQGVIIVVYTPVNNLMLSF